MPQRRNAIKALRQNRVRHMQNQDMTTALRKTTKKFLASVSAKNSSEAAANLQVLYKKIDKAAKENVIHKNTAARRKSRFAKLLKSISQK